MELGDAILWLPFLCSVACRPAPEAPPLYPLPQPPEPTPPLQVPPDPTTAIASAVAFNTQPPASCSAWELEYVLSATLSLSDTPMGQGDGVYAVGPGTVLLRFEDLGGQPGGKATIESYEMRENFSVTSRAFLLMATVVTDAQTHATPDVCGVAARGTLRRWTLQWSTPVSGYRTDGTLTCEGTLCGMLGRPPPGKSELHLGPGPVEFQPFEFGPDLKTFTMSRTFVWKTDVPMQTVHLALEGREVRRACAPATDCP